MSAFSDLDCCAMSRALELAERGLETTDPNPRVGCVIVQGGAIVGEGWHERAGGPHAEIVALAAAGIAARGATAYVSLEPCNHTGRTGPCTEALLVAGIAEVVFAVADPNAYVAGGGARRLAEAGVRVRAGLLESQARSLNIGFMRRIAGGLPWLRLKTAASLDGRTALASGSSRWITGDVARADVHEWRARSSAIVTGVGTVLADDPTLDVRRAAPVSRPPARVVIDSQLRTPAEARLFGAPGELIFIHAGAPPERVRAFEARGVRVEQVEALSSERVDLAGAIERLGKLGMNELWIEAGPTLAGALLEGGFVDEWLHYVAPKLLGPDARALAALPLLEKLDEARTFRLADVQSFGQDLRLRLQPVGAAG